MSDVLVHVLGAVFFSAVLLLAMPFAIPVTASRFGGNVLATKTRYWMVWRWQWALNVAGILIVMLLVGLEAWLVVGWVQSGDAARFFAGEQWWEELWPQFGPWVISNFLSGILLLPVALSLHRRRIAEQVRARHISDVIRQEKIENARKRAADRSAAHRIGIRLDSRTGSILGVGPTAVTVPLALQSGLQAFGFVNTITVRSLADRFYDIRRVRDWVNSAGTHLVMPPTSSSVRALIIAESGSGKTVLINGLVLCALEYGWPVFVLDAKGDPEDAERLVATATSYGRTAATGGAWDLFNGTADQVTAKLMRLMPPPDGANQHYLDEIRGVLQAVQDQDPIRSIGDLRERLTHPGQYVRDQFDLSMVNRTVDRDGTTAAARTMQSLLVGLRPLERWISDTGWSYSAPHADVTVVPLTPVDDAQARIGDLLMLDLRNFMATRLERRDKTPVLVIVDEFPQLVTGSQDPGDTAGSLFETARSAGVGLVLATQSPAGLSNDDVRRRRALTSGAALIFGRSKDPEDVVRYAGTVMQMEASGQASGAELGSARAQHTFVVPPQDVREAADGAFWLVQGGAMARFRALPSRDLSGPVQPPRTRLRRRASQPHGVPDRPHRDSDTGGEEVVAADAAHPLTVPGNSTHTSPNGGGAGSNPENL
jgi:hypothetical protein